MQRWKVVVADHEFTDLRYEEAVFSDFPIDLVVGKCTTEAEVVGFSHDADGILNVYAPISRYVIERLNRCKVISRYGIGVDSIDLSAASAKQIWVTNVPDYGVEEVANHALSLLLSWSRKIVQLDRLVKSGIWDFKLGGTSNRLSEQVVGLIGFGRIPRALLSRLLPLGFQVVVSDPYVDPKEAAILGAKWCSLNELLTISDYISIHAPSTPQNYHLISRKQISLMKQTSVLINTSRGSLIDEGALIEALQLKQISGAALDVLEQEPIAADHPFLTMNNVILTPHSAWYSEQSMIDLRTKAARNIVEVLTGKDPKHAVNIHV